jgi:competence protein ComEC
MELLVCSDPEAYPDRTTFRARVERLARWGEAHRPGEVTRVSLYGPAAGVAPLYGDRLRLQGRLSLPAGPRNPGAPVQRSTLGRQGMATQVRVYRREGIERVGTAPPSALVAWVLAGRDRLRDGLRRSLPPTSAGLAEALVFSSVPALDAERLEEFRRTGTIHLLSTSGVHLTCLTLTLCWLMGRSRRRHRRASACLLIAFLVCYCVAAGARPAVLRATVMGVLFAAGPLADRDCDIANSFLAALLVLLHLNPADLFDLGFQLSGVAVAGLLLLGGAAYAWAGSRLAPRAGALPKALDWSLRGLGVGLAAEAGIAPLVAYYFGMVSPIAPLANLVVVPITLPLVGLSLLHALLATFWLPLSWITGLLVQGLCFWVLLLVRLFASLPLACLDCAPPPAVLLGLFYLGLLLVSRPWRLACET